MDPTRENGLSECTLFSIIALLFYQDSGHIDFTAILHMVIIAAIDSLVAIILSLDNHY